MKINNYCQSGDKEYCGLRTLWLPKMFLFLFFSLLFLSLLFYLRCSILPLFLIDIILGISPLLFLLQVLPCRKNIIRRIIYLILTQRSLGENKKSTREGKDLDCHKTLKSNLSNTLLLLMDSNLLLIGSKCNSITSIL